MDNRMEITLGMAEKYVQQRKKEGGKHKLLIDRYLLSFPDVQQLVEFIDAKMVLSVTHSVNGDYIVFTVNTLNLGYGETMNTFVVNGLNEHNRNTLIDNILELYGEE